MNLKSSIQRETWLLLAALLGVSFLTFSPCLANGFINLDDPAYVTENPLIRQPLMQSLPTIFGGFDLSTYSPLTTLSFSLEYHLYGLNALPYHLDNILLHLINILLVFWLVHQLTERPLIAFLTAALFGIHPLRVESIAWVSERKDLLFSLFYLGGLASYAGTVKKENRKPDLTAPLVWFAFSCLAKPQAMSFPLALFAVDLHFGRTRWREIFFEKLPILAGAVVFLVINAMAIKTNSWDPGLNGVRAFSSFENFLFTNFAVLVYLAKTIWPVSLSVAYPFPSETASHFRGWIVPVAPFLNLALIFLALWLSRAKGACRFGILFFLITLSLPLGLIWTERIFAHDRYTYLPHLGLFLAGISLYTHGAKSTQRTGPSKIFPAILALVLGVTVITLSTISFNRCKVWRDSKALWEDAIAQFPGLTVIYLNHDPA